jgi:glycine/D-amino acid oxidase-like deaminating enzyme/nitrite reductase/ring-hydroxylating ferredoxin subunit
MSSPTSLQPAVTPATGVNANGWTDPIWYAAADVPQYRPLDADTSADVCVIGAGIGGLTTAYLLARTGRSVVVVDMKPVAGGETGRTSAHLASAIDDRFYEIERLHGADGARVQFESHHAAIALIESIAAEENIACDFKRIDGYLFLGDGDKPATLDRELESAHRAGFEGASLMASAPVAGFNSGPCLRFPGQARIQVVQYLAGLARRLAQMGVRIYTGTRVIDVAGGQRTTIRTQAGHTISAAAAVAATNVPTPVNNWAGIYTKIAPYRTYMVGLQIPRGVVTDALYWDTLDPYHYVRLESSAGNATHDVLIVGGEDHKTGQHTSAIEERERFERLEAWTRQRFPSAENLSWRWTGQVNEPDDGVAFIGKVPTSGMENVYTITGDSGMGLTHGTLGALIIADLIQGKVNRWADLYDPARKRLMAGTEWLKENVNAAIQYADYITPGEVANAEEIRPGTGAVVRRGLSKVAVYRDTQGVLHECSAVCTHLKGVVRWNDAEKSWDCPVHGSRFDCNGKLLHGPAIDDLSREV